MAIYNSYMRDSSMQIVVIYRPLSKALGDLVGMASDQSTIITPLHHIEQTQEDTFLKQESKLACNF